MSDLRQGATVWAASIACTARRRPHPPKTSTIHDWEFFFMKTSASGTEIVTRGATETVNRFGGTCFSCHAKAQAKWDMVCEHSHGCDPLPVSDDGIRAIQNADPRPR